MSFLDLAKREETDSELNLKGTVVYLTRNFPELGNKQAKNIVKTWMEHRDSKKNIHPSSLLVPYTSVQDTWFSLIQKELSL